MRRSLRFLVAIFALGCSVVGAEAQTPSSGLDLRISKIFGFNLAGRIQGTFRLTASGRDDLERVRFVIDGDTLGEVSAPPFSLSFDTTSHALGRHVLAAIGTTSSGLSLESPPVTVEFVSPDSALGSTMQIIVPVLVIALGVSVLAIVVPLIGGGCVAYRPGEYGMVGGAVCPRCNLPFSRHLIAPNFLGYRLERCPHCGKWSLATRAKAQDLAAAEARLQAQADATPAPSDGKDSMRRMIDESRFEE